MTFRVGLDPRPVTAGAIQITAATHELVRDAFVRGSRGLVAVKGKQEMETFLLVARAP